MPYRTLPVLRTLASGLAGSLLALCAAGALAAAQDLFHPTLRASPATSVIATPVDTLVITPRTTTFDSTYGNPRAFAVADMNGDGLLDIIAAPAHNQTSPTRALEVWLNNGDGTFRNGTSEVISGAVPQTWFANDIHIGDFNNDGRPDVLLICTGAEHAVADGEAVSGFQNVLLLSQPDGKYIDATSHVPNNTSAYNHKGGIGDVDGDGNLDIVVYKGGSTPEPLLWGTVLFTGDGHGNFADRTASLPPEIRWMQWLNRPDGDLQISACAGAVDLDGDGKAEIVTVSGYGGDYIIPDGPNAGYNNKRTIRIFKRNADGSFAERKRLWIPDPIASIPENIDAAPTVTVPFQGLGCSQITSGKVTGSGRDDLIIMWEGEGTQYIELLRNDGDFQFTDVTMEAFGTYQMHFTVTGANYRAGPGQFVLRDINGDGFLDIVFTLNGVPAGSLLPHLAMLNDGQGHFTPWQPGSTTGTAMTPAEILSGTNCALGAVCMLVPFVFDTTGGGVASLVLLDQQSYVNTQNPTLANPQQPTAVKLTTFTATASKAWLAQVDCLLAWGEQSYSQLLFPQAATLNLQPYRYRYYAGSGGMGSYVGVSAADNQLYYLGPLSGGGIMPMGPFEQWVRNAGCSAASAAKRSHR